MKQPLFRASSDTVALTKLLHAIKPGELLSWDAMTNELGRNASPGGAGYPATLSARKILEREHQIAFEAEPTHGLRRLENVQIVESGDSFISKARRIMKRGIVRLTCVDYESLPRNKQVEHNAKISIMSTIAELGSSKSMRKVEAHIVNANTALPAAKAAVAALGDIK